MSKKLFNKMEIRILQQNKNVKGISEKAITYTEDFKNDFILKSNKGILPRKIFEDAGFDINIIGMKRVEICAYRWKKIYKNRGNLEDTRKKYSGRPLLRELSLEEQISRLEAKNKLLEAENEILKKAELIERGLIFKIKD